jgi:hypothetical protein
MGNFLQERVVEDLFLFSCITLDEGFLYITYFYYIYLVDCPSGRLRGALSDGFIILSLMTTIRPPIRQRYKYRTILGTYFILQQLQLEATLQKLQ